MTILWNEDRKVLLDLLEKKSQVLGDLYRCSVDSLQPEPLTRAALMVTSHCIREIIAGLPSVLEMVSFKQTDVGKQARRLGDAWRAAGYPLSDVTADATAESPAPIAYSVSPAVYIAAQDVALAVSAITMTARRKSALLIAGRIEAAEIPAVRRFYQALDDGFMTWVHFQNYGVPASTLPEIEVVERELTIIEQGLLTRLGNFAERAEILRAALRQANAREDG